jgi:hypothetical protein
MANSYLLNPDSAVEREVMRKEQTFRSEDMPFGIANGKSQIPKYGICNLRSEIPSASEDSLLQVCPSLRDCVAIVISSPKREIFSSHVAENARSLAPLEMTSMSHSFIATQSLKGP